ncbi:MAG: ABC transporter ATP-binding protein [Trueperaceae bacterium]|nr:ABC transporter ATP-binding protein [Trueperaceae bacterium]
MTTSDTAPAPVLATEGLGVRLGGVAILEGIDLALAPGDLTLLVGPNGAGKSTLLRALAGLLPSSGDVRVAGHLPGSTAARATFAFAPDEPALYEDLTLAEHARFTAALYRRPEAEARARALLDAFDLGTKLDEVPASHSRGMRQKLGLALALGLAMPLTLLDEPFNGLDADAQATLARALVQHAAGGGAVLLTGHQQELPATLGARVLALRGGHLVPEA